MKIAQSLQACKFPDFIIWRFVVAEIMLSINYLGVFSFHSMNNGQTPWRLPCGTPPSDCLCVLPHLLHLFPHVPHVLSVAKVMLLQFPLLSSLHWALIQRFPFGLDTLLFQLDIWCASCSSKCRNSSWPCSCSLRENHKAVEGPRSCGVWRGQLKAQTSGAVAEPSWTQSCSLC